MDKKDLTEQETRSCYIMPAIRQSHWQPHQIREKVYITDGQIHPEFRVKVQLRWVWVPAGQRTSTRL